MPLLRAPQLCQPAPPQTLHPLTFAHPPIHRNLKPAWTDLARQLSGKVRVGAVDCTVQKQTCSEFGVQGFPTIRFFGQVRWCQLVPAVHGLHGCACVTSTSV